MNQARLARVRLCGMGLHRTNRDTRVLFVSLAILTAVGCYKTEEPGGLDYAGLETETDATCAGPADARWRQAPVPRRRRLRPPAWPARHV